MGEEDARARRRKDEAEPEKPDAAGESPLESQRTRKQHEEQQRA